MPRCSYFGRINRVGVNRVGKKTKLFADYSVILNAFANAKHARGVRPLCVHNVYKSRRNWQDNSWYCADPVYAHPVHPPTYFQILRILFLNSFNKNAKIAKIGCAGAAAL